MNTTSLQSKMTHIGIYLQKLYWFMTNRDWISSIKFSEDLCTYIGFMSKIGMNKMMKPIVLDGNSNNVFYNLRYPIDAENSVPINIVNFCRRFNLKMRCMILLYIG